MSRMTTNAPANSTVMSTETPTGASPLAVVSARGLTKRFGSFEAVAGIDFDVYEGECFGLLGPNGAGKSTTIRMICCLAALTAGSLTVLGEPAAPGQRTIKAQLGVVSQEDYLDPALTVRENIEIHGRFYGLSPEVATLRAAELLAFMQLEGKTHEQVRSLSGGMRRRLVIARALMGKPRLLVLDEPTTGLDPQARILVWRKLRELKAEGVTVLLTTHYMDEAQRLCDRLVIIDHGRILESGRPRELILRLVGAECLECPDIAPALVDGLMATLRPEDQAWHEWQSDSWVLFSPNLSSILDRWAAADLAPPLSYRRPTGLEDVFLRLTGRELRD